MLPKKYHGLGLPNFALSALGPTIHVLQCHFSFEDALGKMTRQAYEAFVVEVGAYGNTVSQLQNLWRVLNQSNVVSLDLGERRYHDIQIDLKEEFHLRPA